MGRRPASTLPGWRSGGGAEEDSWRGWATIAQRPLSGQKPAGNRGYASLFPRLGTELWRSQVSLFHEKNGLFPRSWGDKG